MPTHRRYQKETLGEFRVDMAGRFYPNGTSNPDSTKSVGTMGWSIVRDAVGLFKVTIDFDFQYLFGKFCSLSEGTITDKVVRFGAEDLSARTVKIGIWDISSQALVDMSAADDLFIDFGWTLKRSGNSGKR